MKEYRVIWTIDLKAKDDIAAAKAALEIQRDPESCALMFEVICMQDPENKEPMKSIDLWDEDEVCPGQAHEGGSMLISESTPA